MSFCYLQINILSAKYTMQFFSLTSMMKT